MKACILYILGTFFILFPIHMSAQLSQTGADIQYLEYKGVIKTSGKSNFQLSECISTSAMIMGVESKTASKAEAQDSSFVRGSNSDSYYVDNYESPAGEVKFKFEYLIKDESINFRLYDFEHIQSDSKFEPVGRLPDSWNETVGSSFTKAQYVEITTDPKLNVANAIRLIKKYCVN